MAAKKLTSILLAFTLILSCVIIPTVVSAETDEIEVWDGTIATSFAGGDGSEENPFIIENGAQLAFAIQYNVTDNSKYNKHFALKNDIYLNEIDKIDWATGKAEEGYTPKPWIYKDCSDGNSGWFHGNGHTVYGLYINDPTYTGRAGLVPMTWNGVKFYDFGIDCAYINTKGQAAFFIGYGKSTSSTYTEFENCRVGENSTLIAGGNASAFIYGQFKYATFKDCYSLAKVSSTASGAKVGAFAADIWGTETMWFKNCYGIGAFSFNAGVHPTYENCYSTAQSATGLTKVDAANMVGAKAQTYMPMLGADFAVTESYPVLKAQLDRDPALWGGFIHKPSDADSDGAYEINTPEKMAWYVKNGGKAILTSDLYLNDLKVTVAGGIPALTKASDGSAIDPADNDLLEWFGTGTALGATSGLTYEFNGDGHVIYGLYHNQPGSGTGAPGQRYAGIFNYIKSGTSIYGVGIEDAYMNSYGAWSAALLVGREDSVTYTIDSCYAGANTYHKGYDVAAICGGGGTPSSPATIKNCYVLTTLSGSHGSTYTNAFTGDNWSASAANYYNCYTSHSSAYRMGTSKVGVYTGVKMDEVKGRDGQVKMPELGDAFVPTPNGPMLKIFLSDVKESVWSGFIANEFAGGTGSEEDPYMIETGSQLARAIHKSAAGKYYKLANDIYLNDLSKINWSNGTVADGYTARNWYDDISVQGNFDGDGHIVYGLYRMNGSAGNWGIGGTALFPKIANTATLNITGFGIDKAYICGWHGGGGFVGNGPNDDTIDSYLNISESFVGENVYIQGYDAGAAVGDNRGIHTTVTDFYSLATLSYKSHGGIATDLWGGSITFNRVYNGNGPLDTKGGSNATNSYATAAGGNGTVVISKDSMKGEQTVVTMFGLGDKFVATESYPVLKLFAENYNEENSLGKAPFVGGGIEADPYLISDAEDLRNMVGLGGMNAYYELTNDIYVNDVNSVDWLTGTVSVGYAPETWFVGKNENGNGYISYVDTNDAFEGTVNGNGYAVHGIYYELGNNSTVGGLIPYANKVTFINLGIEDSFIGSGRFTGGFVGYGKTINLSGCYVDDSCAVFGWDAGADYVNADSDVNVTGGGSGLCRGGATYTYKESENGTYKYDEESGKYVEIGADEEFEGTRYAVDDVILKDVIFTSNALGGLVGRYSTSGTIENCYVTATVKSNPIYAFGKEGQGVTFANPGGNGGGMGHIGGLWGDDWASGTTKVVAATDCFSVIKGHENDTNCTFTEVYTLASDAPAGITKVSLAVGNMGLDQMPGLDKNVWYAVKDSVDYPQLRTRGAAIGDADENGIGAEFADVYALRTTIIGANAYLNADLNRSGTADVCDLVALTKKADEKAKADAKANAALLDTVYLSADGSDQNDGTENAPVATLNKAVTLVQDFGTVIIDGTVTVTSTAKSGKTVLVQGGTVDFSSLSTVNVNSGMVFLDGTTVKFADDSTVYANGNMVVINEGVTVEGTPAAIYGGGTRPVRYTSLWLKAGDYKAIYGGGNGAAVLGSTELQLAGTVNATLPLTASGASYIYGGGKNSDVYGATYVYVGGKVNEPLDHTSHTAIARIYGGCNGGTVMRDTVLDIAENAEFNYIYGGGAGTSEVKGATNIYFSGKAMSIYGGSGTVYETNVTVNGGWIHQVFGGCESASMTGNTNVTINGGYIDRRIVGGCYNDASLSGLSMKYASEHYVTGNCTVTLRDEATYNLKGDDHGITALSRHSTNHTDEEGVLVFENTALQTKLKSNLGIHWLLGTLAPAADSQIIGE